MEHRRQEREGGPHHHLALAQRRVRRQEDVADARSVVRVIAKHNPPLLQYVHCGGASSRERRSFRRAGGSSGIGIERTGIGTGTGTGIGSSIADGTGISFGTSTSISPTSPTSATCLKTHARIFQWHARSCTGALALEPIAERLT